MSGIMEGDAEPLEEDGPLLLPEGELPSMLMGGIKVVYEEGAPMKEGGEEAGMSSACPLPSIVADPVAEVEEKKEAEPDPTDGEIEGEEGLDAERTEEAVGVLDTLPCECIE